MATTTLAGSCVKNPFNQLLPDRIRSSLGTQMIFFLSSAPLHHIGVATQTLTSPNPITYAHTHIVQTCKRTNVQTRGKVPQTDYQCSNHKRSCDAAGELVNHYSPGVFCRLVESCLCVFYFAIFLRPLLPWPTHTSGGYLRCKTADGVFGLHSSRWAARHTNRAPKTWASVCVGFLLSNYMYSGITTNTHHAS